MAETFPATTVGGSTFYDLTQAGGGSVRAGPSTLPAPPLWADRRHPPPRVTWNPVLDVVIPVYNEEAASEPLACSGCGIT